MPVAVAGSWGALLPRGARRVPRQLVAPARPNNSLLLILLTQAEMQADRAAQPCRRTMSDPQACSPTSAPSGRPAAAGLPEGAAAGLPRWVACRARGGAEGVLGRQALPSCSCLGGSTLAEARRRYWLKHQGVAWRP